MVSLPQSTHFSGTVSRYLDTVPLKCVDCGRLTTKGEGDSTEFRDGITYDIWFARVMLMKMVDSAEEF